MAKHLPRERSFEYDHVVKQPALVVEPNEVFTVDTEDALNGAIRSESHLPVPEHIGPHETHRGNPCAGPIVIQTARAGDTLVVNIHDIVVDEQGVSCIFPGDGPLGDSAKYPDCRGPHTKILRHLPGPSGTTSDGVCVFSDGVTWNLNPHIGTIAVAPLYPIAAGADSVTGQGAHGGNLDCRHIGKGSRVLLPVYHDGAYLYLGDVHASQADGEFYGSADEARARLTLSCDVISWKHTPWLRVETADSIIQLYSYRPLEDAVEQAFLHLIDWLVQDYGFSPRDAYMHMDLNADVRIHIYQMVKLRRLNYAVGVSFPRRLLPR